MRPTILLAVTTSLLLLLTGSADAASRPDLEITSLVDPPSVLSPGAAFSTQIAIRNRGRKRSPPSTTGFYLTETPRAGKDSAIRLARQRTPQLRAQQSVLREIRFDVPASASNAPAEYFLLACADDAAKVRESSERNNCLVSSFTLTIRPY